MKHGSISVCFVVEALVEARRRGVDIASLMTRTGFPSGILETPLARVSPQQYGRLWNMLVVELGDEFFAMDTHPIRPGSFSFLCYALLTCANMQHALKRMLRFLSFVHDDISGNLCVIDGQASLNLVDRAGPKRLFAHATLFVMIRGLACWLAGRRLPIVEVSFCQAAPEHAAEYSLVFGKSLRFAQSVSRLVLDANCLSLPIVRDEAAAREFISQAPANLLVQYRNRSGPVARVRERLGQIEPAHWPDFESLATTMNTTASTLRRHLEKDGYSYQSIKDDLRRDLSLDLLRSSGMTIVEIAHTLGFSEHGAFHRAFRKWTGARPGDYRLRKSR